MNFDIKAHQFYSPINLSSNTCFLYTRPLFHFSSMGLHRLLLQEVCVGAYQRAVPQASHLCVWVCACVCVCVCVCVCMRERDWTPVKSKLPLCLLPESPVSENSVCLGAKRDWWIIKACWSFTHREPADHWHTTAHTHIERPVQCNTHRVPYSQSLHMKNVDCSCWAKLVDFSVCSCRWTAVAFQTSSYRLLLLAHYSRKKHHPTWLPTFAACSLNPTQESDRIYEELLLPFIL